LDVDVDNEDRGVGIGVDESVGDADNDVYVVDE